MKVLKTVLQKKNVSLLGYLHVARAVTLHALSGDTITARAGWQL